MKCPTTRTLTTRVADTSVPLQRKSPPGSLASSSRGKPGCIEALGSRNASKMHILSPESFPGAWQASEMRTLSTKVRQKRVPSARNSAPKTPASVKNTYPQPKSASKTRTLSPKVRPHDPGERQKRAPSTKKCVKNVYPQPEIPPPGPRRASKTRILNKKMCQKRVPFARKSAPKTPASVKNAHPRPKSVSKTRTLSLKVRRSSSIRICHAHAKPTSVQKSKHVMEGSGSTNTPKLEHGALFCAARGPQRPASGPAERHRGNVGTGRSGSKVIPMGTPILNPRRFT